MNSKRLIVLDSLFEDLDVERSTAAALGWELEPWDGSAHHLGQADAVVHVRTRIDPAMIAQLERCRVIGRFGVGLDSVDLPAATQSGMSVVNVRDYCVPEMTAHTLGLAFLLERRLSGWHNAAWLDTDWQKFARVHPITGRSTVTVVGLGSIGTAVASALRDLGYTVVAVTERGRANAERIGLRTVTLDDGLRSADLVFLHAALEPSTANLIDGRRLSLMRQGSILINTARLGLIDQGAVAGELAAGRLAGLGLDARLEPASPLRKFASDPRVMITPHVGWYSERSARVLRERAIVNSIEAYAKVSRRAS